MFFIYLFFQSSNEIHYAELALAHNNQHHHGSINHLNHLKKLPPPPAYSHYFDEPSFYAQLDHRSLKSTSSPFPLASLPPTSSTTTSTALNHSSNLTLQHRHGSPNHRPQHLREIVTMRTPLSFTQQESCV